MYIADGSRLFIYGLDMQLQWRYTWTSICASRLVKGAVQRALYTHLNHTKPWCNHTKPWCNHTKPWCNQPTQSVLEYARTSQDTGDTLQCVRWTETKLRHWPATSHMHVTPCRTSLRPLNKLCCYMYFWTRGRVIMGNKAQAWLWSAHTSHNKSP